MHPSGPPPGPPPGGPPPGPPPQGYPPQGAPGGYPPQQHQHYAPKAPIPGQNIAIGLLVCAGLIAIAVFSHGWVTIGSGDESGGFGPMGACGGPMCLSWGDLDRGGDGHVPGDLVAFGYGTLIAGLIAAGLCGACGGMMLSRNPVKAPYKPARAVLGAATGLAAAFTVRLFTLDELGRHAGPGWSLFVGIGALITGMVLTSKVAPFANYSVAMGGPGGPPMGPPGGVPYGGAPGGMAPGGMPPGGNPYAAAPQQPPQQQMHPGIAPTMAATQPQAQPSHPCPRCQRPLVFVAQYQRWFCESCKQYA